MQAEAAPHPSTSIMPGIIMYPGIALGSLEFFYDNCRMQRIPDAPHEEAVHSVYECTERSESDPGTKCPVVLTIKDVIEVNEKSIARLGPNNLISYLHKNLQGTGKYVITGSHNHQGDWNCVLQRDAWFRSVMYDCVQVAKPHKDLKEFLAPSMARFRYYLCNCIDRDPSDHPIGIPS